ncbi:hypothetical protein [Mixta intestinalis]|uniref:Uncharacterized protein n=1 Tax=Mixta intestinalis TaxID=1615494 RepID=A0A6P1Q4R8_9GAMM|nr:hypothetical protein [Mixta intestinalis]QHM74040.1 hypothetical protein C7M51_04401 [Mixta intestinalis]
MHQMFDHSVTEHGMSDTAEAERAYWQSREKAAVKSPEEIDVHAFHDALGVMYPMNWQGSGEGEYETFMLAEMVCGDVTQIYARLGNRYYRMCDKNTLRHADILARVREEWRNVK